ncbi:MerR family transcriptional regulator [Priestia flexa]|uniref:MerR family transcriptional regulator n=1 Tax=Priestia flexa TaxID=86664 RepID=UPI003FD46FBF
MKYKECYTQTELARKCGVSESTIRKYRNDFSNFILPIKKDNNVIYSQYDYFKIVFIQGLRKNHPFCPSSHIMEDVKDFCEELRILEFINNKYK